MLYTEHTPRQDRQRAKAEARAAELTALDAALNRAWTQYNNEPTENNFAAVEALTQRIRKLTKGR